MISSVAEQLTDPGELTRFLVAGGMDIEAAEATYVRYKPGSGMVVALEMRSEARTHRGYLRWSHEKERAARIVAKANTKKPACSDLGPGVRLLDPHAALFLFPNDAKIRRLRWVSSAEKIRYVVGDHLGGAPFDYLRSSVKVLRYKPERRLVGLAHLVPKSPKRPDLSFFFRLTSNSAAPKLGRVNTAARAAGINVPEPIACLEDGRLHLEEALTAEPLVETIRQNRPEPAAIADILGRIGRIDKAGLDVETPGFDLYRTQRVLDDVASYLPGPNREFRLLSALLDRRAPCPGRLGVSHGDLHLNQFMVDGDAVWLVDWERAAIGHPYRDAGRLLAHPHALAVRRPELPIALLTSLVGESVELHQQDNPSGSGDLAFYTAAALLDQALLVSRHLEPGFEDRAKVLLDMAGDVMQHGASVLR